jgi:hypothetical protein
LQIYEGWSYCIAQRGFSKYWVLKRFLGSEGKPVLAGFKALFKTAGFCKPLGLFQNPAGAETSFPGEAPIHLGVCGVNHGIGN